MLATEMFVKLCSIMVMDALINGMWTSIASGSELAHPRPGTDSSRLDKEREWAFEFGNCLRGMAIVAVTCFMDRTVCRTTHT